MRIIRNYVLEEVWNHFLVALLVLTFILLVGNVFSKMFDLVLNRGVDVLRMMELFLHSTPFLFVFTIPMAALVAILLTFGRLSADHEIIALRASGVSIKRIIRPVILVSVVLSLFTLYLNDQVASRSHYRVREISSDIGLKAPAAILEEGVFIKSFKDIILFIHRIEGNKLYQIRIYQPQEDGPTRTVIAEKGELIPIPEQNLIKLKLINGTSDEPDPKNPGRFYKLKFGTYYLPLDISRFKFKANLSKKRKELTINELWTHFQKLKREGFVDNYLLTEIHRKVAMSLSVLVLTLIAIPLAMKTGRSEKSIGFALALIVGTFYWAFLIGMSSLSKMGTLPPWAAMHLPNFVIGLVGLGLLWRLLRT